MRKSRSASIPPEIMRKECHQLTFKNRIYLLFINFFLHLERLHSHLPCSLSAFSADTIADSRGYGDF